MMSLELREEESATGSEGSMYSSSCDDHDHEEAADSPTALAQVHTKRLAATSTSPRPSAAAGTRAAARQQRAAGVAAGRGSADASPAPLQSAVNGTAAVSSRVLIVHESPGQTVFSLTSLGLSCTGCDSVEEVSEKTLSGLEFEVIVVS